MTARATLDFYFDYLSPWAYFSWQKVRALIADGRVTVNLHPVPYPKLSEAWEQKAIATIPPKRLFIFKAATRYALRHGIPFVKPKFHPYKPYTSLRMSLASVAGARQAELVDALFRACWQAQVDMGSDAELARFLTDQGFPGEEWVRRAQESAVKEELSERTAQATKVGVFGVPTFMIEGELFWGNDQIEDVMEFLAGRDLLATRPTSESVLSPHSWGLGETAPPTVKITGVAHTVLTVDDFSRSRPFYDGFLAYLGLTKVFDGDEMLYYVGGKTAIGIMARPQSVPAGGRFEQGRVGLHHLCLRARSREVIDELHAWLQKQGAVVVHSPEEGPWAPGYYSVLFEDPDGIRLEVNHVPGKGLLAKGERFEPAGDYR